MALKSELEFNPYALTWDDVDQSVADRYRSQFDSFEEFLEAVRIWPKCPKCGELRISRCPVCKTSANLFPIGDSEFFDPDMPQDAGKGIAPVRRSCCGNCAAHAAEKTETQSSGELLPGLPDLRKPAAPVDESHEFDGLEDERSVVGEWNENVAVICPVCSEAFHPVFLKRCEWCGHEFEDGEDFDAEQASESGDVEEFLARKQQEDEESEALSANGNRVAVIIAILALLAGVFVFFASRGFH